MCSFLIAHYSWMGTKLETMTSHWLWLGCGCALVCVDVCVCGCKLYTLCSHFLLLFLMQFSCCLPLSCMLNAQEAAAVAVATPQMCLFMPRADVASVGTLPHVPRQRHINITHTPGSQKTNLIYALTCSRCNKLMPYKHND